MLIDIEREESKFTLQGRVQKNFEDGLCILFPTFADRCFLFFPEDVIYLRFKRGSRMFRWEVGNLSSITLRGFNMIYIESGGDSEEYNKRSAFRVPVSVPSFMMDEAEDSFKSIVLDISLIGIGFSSEHILEKNDRIHAVLDCGSFGQLNLTLTVTRVGGKDDIRGFSYGAVISESNRGLAEFVAKQQTEYLRSRTLLSG